MQLPTNQSDENTNGSTNSSLTPNQESGDSMEESRSVKSLEEFRVPKIYKRGKKSKSKRMRLVRTVKKSLRYPSSRSEVAIR